MFCRGDFTSSFCDTGIRAQLAEVNARQVGYYPAAFFASALS
jgi:hypothetical protein